MRTYGEMSARRRASTRRQQLLGKLVAFVPKCWDGKNVLRVGRMRLRRRVVGGI